MRCGKRAIDAGRRGFTLVEMIVVVSILLLLATLVVAFFPRVNEQQKPRTGADNVQGWLFIAKQWARRDRVPSGLRIVRDPATDLSAQIMYLEQPPDFRVQPGVPGSSNPDIRGLNISGTTAPLETASLGTAPDFAGGYMVGEEPQWPVQIGDYLEVEGGGDNAIWVFRVMSVSPTSVTLDRAPSGLSSSTHWKYSFIRNPRPRAGEAPLQL